jgi:ABC-2 type transport system permease protein
MKKSWLIFRNEFLSVISRKSFIVTLFLFPLMGFLIVFIVSGIQKSSGTDTGSMISELLIPSVKVTLEGFVDESGLVKGIPAGYQYRLKQYDSEVDARIALNESEISAFYVIKPDYIENGTIIYVRPDYNPLGGSMQSTSVEALMAYNLTGGNLQLYYRLENPLILTTQTIETTGPERDQNNPLTFFLPYAVTFLFYIVIMTSASLLLSSISNEKQSRVMEVLMTSVDPQEMLTGKIVALGLAGLLQTIVWSGSGLLLLRLSGRTLALGSAFQLPVSIMVWGILFFLFGYAVYASLMAGVGALVPNMREASQLTMIIVIPLIIPLMFISTLIQAPNSVLAVIFSIFPLTAPVAMMTRLAATQVPVWQILLSLALLAACAVYFVRTVANLFRAQNLLSGKSVNGFTYLKALFGKNNI